MATFSYLFIALAATMTATCCKADPGQIVQNALSCFNDQSIYKNCDEAYRLSPSGYLNVPYSATNQFCSGPCLDETYLVLDCIDQTLSNFVFYNRATIEDVRAAVQGGCGQSSRRGDFNVEDYLQGDWSNAVPVLTPHNLLFKFFACSVSLFIAARIYNVMMQGN
ncbi:hypothetical protein Drorol1_Dr00001897 [Drosera rotundifolia]